MNRIDVPLQHGRSYPVMVGHGLLQQPELWMPFVPDAPRVIISNERVAPLYLDAVLGPLGNQPVHTLILPDGEAEKSFDNYRRAMDFLASNGIRRDACLIALGGGVVGDLCGFVAATWMRGVKFLQIPTTLLAQVDASVGGKTAINISAGKNLVGAFHQPVAVVADIATLTTLDDREYRAGLAEVLKYGAIRDAEMLLDMEQQAAALLARDPECLKDMVSRSVTHKAEIVAADEHEAGVRALLNFGHSFGHALEAATAYEQFLHGEAVAMGMVVAARLSEQRGLCEPGVSSRLASALQTLQLPITIPATISTDTLLDLMLLDKKNTTTAQRLILLKEAGSAMIDAGSREQDLRRAIDSSR